MSADWFCKIGEKKVGPLNNQQLKTFVAKGQLKPEHLVRRGSEGPWVPAGRIKGLFAAGGASPPPGQDKPAAKPLPTAAKAAPLPTAAESPPPPSDVPPELAPGPQHKHHVEMNVDKFNIETTPVMVSRRKMKTGLKSLKKSDQKKVTTILLGLIGGGTIIGAIIIIWAIASGPSAPQPEPIKAANEPAAGDSGAKPAAEKKPAEKKPVQAQWPTSWNKVSVETATAGDVNVMVLKPFRGAPPKGIKAADNEPVLIVPVNLSLKEGAKKSVPLASWADEKLRKSVFLKDDEKEGKGNVFELLGVVPRDGDDASQVTAAKRIQIRLIFEMPAKLPKTMYVVLPGAAMQADGTIIAYEFDKGDIEPPKADAPGATAPGESADAAHKEGAK